MFRQLSQNKWKLNLLCLLTCSSLKDILIILACFFNLEGQLDSKEIQNLGNDFTSTFYDQIGLEALRQNFEIVEEYRSHSSLVVD
jgi:hypothetical protein